MRIHLHVARLLIAIATIISTAPVFASDGQLEINQACAVNTGCFSGDTPGFPVTVDGSAGRSYRLTGDLVIPNVDSDGILVSAPDVSIDLGGFTIVGLACLGEISNCTPSTGSGSGVEVPGFREIPGTSVKNGSIVGMGAWGVSLGDQAEVSGLRVRWNRLVGISTRFGSDVTGNTAFDNGYGISTSAGSTIAGNTAYRNENYGISADSGSTVSGNTVFLNGDDGIRAFFGSTISGNTVDRNGGDGISTNGSGLVQRNSVRASGGFGLRLGPNTAYRENVITGTTVSGGVNMFSNSCNGKTTCP